ncbi:hypothetical protein EST38_g10493 [Candolleomyces aberdarensis]|uniref:Cytochrome P450 n=1 Tax=Candolleomyces aberdarensis TaxID=2316362 RepID=A0A4Q2D9G0_9AGAR|nr:hypothetical protein EST38_g10493 [Candolleomyces aberdarensis]
MATDLLETRSSIYSSRTPLPMINELMGWDFNVAFMPYGARWRKNRRVAQHSLSPVATKEYRPYITKSTRKLLKRLLDDPDPFNIMPHLQHMTGDTVLSVAYGLKIQENDPYRAASEASFHAVAKAGVPGAFLVDTFPLLKYVPAWFPGASFQRKAREWHKLARATLELPYAAAKKGLETGTATVSVVSTCLQKIAEGTEDDAFTEETIRGTAATLFAAGADTTVSAIASCILGLLEHPEVLKKAQAQIDSVVTPGDLPGFEHESSLPYITAIAHETLRWRDVTPIGTLQPLVYTLARATDPCMANLAVPHLLSTEDEYEGYRLPAGAVIVANAWQVFPKSWVMLHDESVYPDPFTFSPDRFINPETGEIDFTRQRNPSFACWGFGRRICPGRHVAFSSIWLAIASLVSVFDIEKAKEKVRVVGEDGIEREKERTVELTHEYLSSLAM